MLGEADEGQSLASYRAGVLGPSGLVRSSASQELLHKCACSPGGKNCCAPSLSGCKVHI